MPEIRSRGARIRYEDEGRVEPALLFLPGWCTSRAVFSPVVSRLSARHRVLSMDLRGHGQSEQGDEDFTSNTLVDDALAVVQASGARCRPPCPWCNARSHFPTLEVPEAVAEYIGRFVSGLGVQDPAAPAPPSPAH